MGPGESRGFVVFAGVFEGGPEKVRAKRGVFVVERW
jgi:hypothetical protein